MPFDRDAFQNGLLCGYAQESQMDRAWIDLIPLFFAFERCWSFTGRRRASAAPRLGTSTHYCFKVMDWCQAQFSIPQPLPGKSRSCVLQVKNGSGQTILISALGLFP